MFETDFCHKSAAKRWIMVHVLKHLHILQDSQELKWISQLLLLEIHEENVSVRQEDPLPIVSIFTPV